MGKIKTQHIRLWRTSENDVLNKKYELSIKWYGRQNETYIQLIIRVPEERSKENEWEAILETVEKFPELIENKLLGSESTMRKK